MADTGTIAALRDPSDPLYEPIRRAVHDRTPLRVDILYGDHEGGQRAITRMSLVPREHAADGESWLWICTTARHWNLDRADPR